MTTPTALPYVPTPAQRRARLIFWVLMGFAAFYLIAEHRLHLAGLWRWLPILILLACPLLHLFVHGGHGGHGGHGDPDADSAPAQDVPPVAEGSTPPATIPRTQRSHTHRGDLP
ncbi:MAG: hypothetical protein A3E01_14510 [Gammaproteobacteria bacterium RIFCSPHIGHO2_12_FULL_63_22]|nr:MAG: hypothetical protein A3E01_14510 [Gammaproteobacteria bacterium RIFCSPHIGHO2_12_FULL_63_22]